MLWEEEESKLMVCGGSSWRQVRVISIISVLVFYIISIIDKIIVCTKTIINVILCRLMFVTRCIQPATAGHQGKLRDDWCQKFGCISGR